MRFLTNLYEDLHLHQRSSDCCNDAHLHHVVRKAFARSQVASETSEDVQREGPSESRGAFSKRSVEYGYLIRLSMGESKTPSIDDKHTLGQADIITVLEDVVESVLERRGLVTARRLPRKLSYEERDDSDDDEECASHKRQRQEQSSPVDRLNAGGQGIDRRFLNYDPVITLDSIHRSPEWMRQYITRSGQNHISHDLEGESDQTNRFAKGAATRHELSFPLLSQSSSRFFQASAHQVALDKSSLANVRHIAQISNQFLACVVDVEADQKDQALVVIDQHAADERVGVERLFRRFVECCSLGEAPVLRLRRPIQFRISADLIREFDSPHAQQLLSYWGFGIRRSIDDRDCLEMVEHPDCFRTESLSAMGVAELATDLAVWLQDGVGGAFVTRDWPDRKSKRSEREDEHRWISAMRHMPPPMREAINSRACRSAISELNAAASTKIEGLAQPVGAHTTVVQFATQCSVTCSAKSNARSSCVNWLEQLSRFSVHMEGMYG